MFNIITDFSGMKKLNRKMENKLKGSVMIFVMLISAFGVAILTVFLQDSFFYARYKNSQKVYADTSVYASSFQELMLAHLCAFVDQKSSTLDVSKKNLGLTDNDKLLGFDEIIDELTKSLCKSMKKQDIAFKFNYIGNGMLEVTSEEDRELTFTVIYKFEDILTRIPLCKSFQSITTVDGKSKLWETGLGVPDFGPDVLKEDDFPIRSWDLVSQKLKTPIEDLQKYFTIDPCIINNADNNVGSLKINLSHSNEDLINAVKLNGGSDKLKDSNLSQINSKFFGHTTTFFRLTTIVKSGPKRSTIRVTCQCGSGKNNTTYSKNLSSNNTQSSLPFTIILTERF